MTISEDDLARWAAFVAVLPSGGWWLVDDDEETCYCTTEPPHPWDPAAGRLPDGDPVRWSYGYGDPGAPLTDADDDTWDYRYTEPYEVEVEWVSMVRLACAARDAIPALMAEVRRLRAALAAQEAYSVALRDLAEALNAARDHEGEVRDAE